MVEMVKASVVGDLSSLYGKKIVHADSSLQNFSIELEGATGLSLEARGDKSELSLTATVVDSSSLPRLSEAVCSVDWSWIYGATVSEISVLSDTVRLSLQPVGPLSISLSVWQGSPFLAFQPFRPANK
jgi:hypothetical protein